MTPGFSLPAAYVIHAVGPVWRGGDQGERQLLTSCYQGALRLARERGLRSLAFPAISAGVYGYPMDLAASVAVQTVEAELVGGDDGITVTFCTFGQEATHHYQRAFEALRGEAR